MNRRPALALALALAPVLMLGACKPPPSDADMHRPLAEGDADFASPPLPSPDTTGAIWAPGGPMRLLYGKVGHPPLAALECRRDARGARLVLTRFARADEGAKALGAIVGHGGALRVKLDAVEGAHGHWLWRGAIAADEENLDALTSAREAALTIPGAGRLVLNPSPRPRELIEQCRAPGK